MSAPGSRCSPIGCANATAPSNAISASNISNASPPPTATSSSTTTRLRCSSWTPPKSISSPTPRISPTWCERSTTRAKAPSISSREKPDPSYRSGAARRPLDFARQSEILFRDPALAVRRTAHRHPRVVDRYVGMMVGGFGLLRHAVHESDRIHELLESVHLADRVPLPLPSGQCLEILGHLRVAQLRHRALPPCRTCFDG